LLIALVAFVVIDYITGVMCAAADKKLSSEVGFKGICRKVLISVLLSALLILSGFMIYKELSDWQKEKEDFAELAELVQITTPEQPEPDATESLTDDEPEPAHKRDLVPLFAENSECIGWLCIPDTVVNYPVMHTPENPQKYLRRNFYGEYSQSGTYFLDGRCSMESDNLIIYGHNMRNDTMFGSLPKYMEEAYRQAHSVIEFETETGCAEYTVFAVVTVKKQDDWYGFINAADCEEFKKQLEQIRSKALYCSDDMPEYGAQLLTLSTCYNSANDGRLLVIAMKL